MTTEISTGTVSQTGNTNRVTGTVSGLDTDSLVQNAVDANNAEADNIDIRVQENDTKIAGYNEFFGLADSLQTSLSSLKSDNSALASDNTFDQRSADLTSNGAEPTSLVNVTIEERAPQGTYEIVVEQKAESFSTGSVSITDDTAALGYSGTFEIGLDGFTATTITVNATDSLQDIVSAINADTANSGVSASVLKVSETDYQLILTGTQTNTAMSINTVSGNVMQNLGIVDATDTFEAGQIIQNEQGSQITLDGATITRDDNTYDDLIEGINFEITAEDPATTITIDVTNDASAAKDEILAFVDAYNAYRDFVLTNQEVSDDGTVSEDATLFSDNLLEILSNDLTNALNTFKSDNGTVTNLADLGIEFDDNNRLVLQDESKLDDALLNDFDSVANFFTTQTEISDSSLGLISNTSTQNSLNFDLRITMNPDGSIASATTSDGFSFEVDGSNLTGGAGTPYEGLVFAYIGTADATISVNMEAGIADIISNSIEGYTNPVDGLIQDEIDALTATNEDLVIEAEEIRERGEEIRERETLKYAAMEAELQRLESLLTTIQALLGTDDD